MATTLVRKVTLRITADDGDTEAKLDRIDAKADELAAKHPELKVRIDTAAASAKIAVLRKELKDTQDQADGTSKSLSGIFGKIAGFFGGGEGGGEGAAGGLPMSGLFGLPALLAIIPAAEAALVEVTGLVSGFAAAGAGAGAFALLALPAFKKVSTAYSQINTDQLAYNRALTAAQRSTALKHLQQDYAALDPSQRAAVKGIQGLVSGFDKMARAFEPQVFAIFNDGLRIANQLLPTLTPFADAFSKALGGLLGQVSRFAGSSGFKDWLAQFRQLTGPSLTAIGVGVGHVTAAFGKLLTTMSAKDVVNSINIAFSILTGTINGLIFVVSHIMHSWDQLTSATDHLRSDMADDGHDIAHTFDTIRAGAANMAHGLASDFDAVRGFYHSWYSDTVNIGSQVVGWFRRLPGMILSALGNLGSLLFSAGQNAIEGLVRGAESMIGSAMSRLAGLGHDLISAIGSPFGIHFSEPSQAVQMIKAGRNVVLGLAAGMTTATPAATAAAQRVGRAAYPALAGAHGGAGGYGTLQIEWVGGQSDQQFLTWIKRNIRIRGGNVDNLGR